MRNFGKEYDSAKIYNDSIASKLEKSPNNNSPSSSNLHNLKLEKFSNNNPQTKTIDKIRVSKITNSNFDEIFKLCIGNKQTKIIKQQKLMTSIKEKFEKVHGNLWGPYDPSSL